MNQHGDYSSRKFLLACVLIATAGSALFTGHMTGGEFGAFAGGIFTVFAGGDVALNAVYQRQASNAPPSLTP